MRRLPIRCAYGCRFLRLAVALFGALCLALIPASLELWQPSSSWAGRRAAPTFLFPGPSCFASHEEPGPPKAACKSRLPDEKAHQLGYLAVLAAGVSLFAARHSRGRWLEARSAYYRHAVVGVKQQESYLEQLPMCHVIDDTPYGPRLHNKERSEEVTPRPRKVKHNGKKEAIQAWKRDRMSKLDDARIEDKNRTLRAQRIREKRAHEARNKNSAFLFIKPHANVPKVVELVENRLRKAKIGIVQQGEVRSLDLQGGKIIDRHYGSLAMRALKTKPLHLAVLDEGRKGFEEVFKLSWREALERDLVVNAKEAERRLGLHPDGVELDRLWSPLQFGEGKVKLASSCYAGRIRGLYVINGFYMGMRAKFTCADRPVHWMSIHWNSEDISWETFRKDFIGHTDPTRAPSESLRGEVLKKWAELKLKAEPDTGNNVVHASASPFEALLERMNWLQRGISDDPFGQALLAEGITEETLKGWSKDPVITQEGGRTCALFDFFENLDSDKCLQMAKRLCHNKEP